MVGFITKLYVEDLDDKFSRLTGALVYRSDLLNDDIWIPAGFTTDSSSVPRVPIVFWFWGGRAHREGILHDYLFRVDSLPKVSFRMANKIFLEAMKSRGKSLFVRLPMYVGVVVGGWFSYHKHKVGDGIEELRGVS